MKIVINDVYGGFGLSSLAEVEYAKLMGFNVYRYTQTQYKHKHGKDLYEKVDQLDENFITSTFKEDKGDSFTEFPVDSSYWYSSDIERDDPKLVEVVERLGEAANGDFADLKIVDIPDDVEWDIIDYDGMEYVAEKHRTWS